MPSGLGLADPGSSGPVGSRRPPLLVLCIDRDDDRGLKTSIRSPVVGREKVLDAATRLALADPTESDANALFGSLKLLDDLRAKGEEAEVAAVSGHPNVGLQSDRTIAAQLDEVVRKTGAQRTIVVSDGADDEFVLPLVQSRLRLEAIHRVVVAQSAALKGLYYQITKALEDPRFGKRFLVPVGLMLLLFAGFSAVGEGGLASIAVMLFLGAYIALRGLGWGEEMAGALRRVERAMGEGQLTLLFYLAAALVTALGALVGYTDIQDEWLRRGPTIYVPGPMPVSFMLTAKFVNSAMGWLGGAALIFLTGRILGNLVAGRVAWSAIGGLFYATATTLLLWATSVVLLSMGAISDVTLPIAQRVFGFALTGTVLLSMVGMWIGRSRRRAAGAEPRPSL